MESMSLDLEHIKGSVDRLIAPTIRFLRNVAVKLENMINVLEILVQLGDENFGGVPISALLE